MKVRIAKVTIEIVAEPNSNYPTTICTRTAADYAWVIDGPIYSRHMKVLTKISDAIREGDNES